MIAARNNPFASERVEALLPYDPTWIGDSWEAILGRLEKLAWRGTVEGPHGSGKTTFLETLKHELEARGHVVEPLFVNRQSGSAVDPEFLASLGRERVILFDGGEQLSWWAWRRFLRETAQVRGLIITAHRPGRLPTLLETRVTPEILARCIGRLDGECAMDLRGAKGLFTRHAGNIRHALLECYGAAVSRSPGPTAP